MSGAAIIDAVLVDHLVNLPPAERLSVIDELLHRLQFERRLAALTDDERRYMNANEELSEAQRARLSACPTPAARARVIEGYARARYLTRCAWSDYLNGVVPDKPYSSPVATPAPGAAS